MIFETGFTMVAIKIVFYISQQRRWQFSCWVSLGVPLTSPSLALPYQGDAVSYGETYTFEEGPDEWVLPTPEIGKAFVVSAIYAGIEDGSNTMDVTEIIKKATANEEAFQVPPNPSRVDSHPNPTFSNNQSLTSA